MEFSMQEAGNTLEVMMQGRFTFSENQKFKLILQQAMSTSILLRGAQGQVKKMLNVSCFEVLFGMA